LQGWRAVGSHGDKQAGSPYHRVVKKSLLALVSVLVIAACGGTATATPSATPKISFPITAQNASAVSGTAEAVRTGDSFSLTVKLTGLMANSSHIAHIHSGRCATPGGVAYALQQLIADGSGAGSMVTIVPTAYSVPSSGWYVNIHRGPDFSAPANAPSIACGDMPSA
jgi:hypothetical protein